MYALEFGSTKGIFGVLCLTYSNCKSSHLCLSFSALFFIKSELGGHFMAYIEHILVLGKGSVQ